MNSRYDLAHTPLVQAADMAPRGGSSVDWKREFILHLDLAEACTFECIFLGRSAPLCHWPSQPPSRFIQAVLQRLIISP